jgi:hypothetical protein
MASLAPTPLTFAAQALAVPSAAQVVTLSNTGLGTLSVTSIALSGVNVTEFAQTNTCGVLPATLAVGATGTCAISVTFTPATIGAKTATLTVVDAAGTQTVVLNGTGATATPAVATLTPATPLAFGSVAVWSASAPQVATLTNSGGAALAITGISMGGTNPFVFAQTNNCGASLAAGASCAINVTFTPNGTGAKSAVLNVVDALGTQSLAVSGTGGVATTPATVTLTPGSLAFGTLTVWAVSPAQVATLTNTGTTALPMTGISLGGTNPFVFSQTNTCGTSLAAGASCTISVKFTPNGVGAKSATLNVVDGAGTQTVALSGTGATAATPATVTLTPASLAFGSLATWSVSAAQVATLTNTGTTAMAITSITMGGTNPFVFSQTNTCGTSLAAGASCTISVKFTPNGVGAKSATVNVLDAVGTQSVSLSGTGL